MVKCVLFLSVLVLLEVVICKSNISKCLFFDKRNSDLKQTFYVPTSDVNMYKATIQKLLTKEISLLDESLDGNEKSSLNNSNNNISNFEDIKQKDEKKKKNKEFEEKLKYIEKYRNYARNVLKNVEFKCESIDDYESKIKCNLCVYTEIVNNKHIRQGQIVQIFMNECMYGFYYYDNINQYTSNNKAIKNISDHNSESKLDDIYFSITKDVVNGNTDQINFFKQQSSKYHPVCYVTE
ncbi:hypothetical protein MKS88_000988 [Plasmodium brasilianum]|uniref:Uncharacterized protein n=2 Tax=Plasmodium (Plasmodium) TaxID=418103 RepID=A0A1A8VNY3_PLAMA|nr:conserved Plasmodium protein, unknown function [Plasmodium malariae]KAI4840753.1 hypothetical protein MKS88_000988 [Plasmodium brasilianum]SBS82096.1 hypothetical protein, conserved [Plasmodium malariae]SBT70458.1 conserved Plasmodium protein, unknown function [Plasmodium malariae]SBT86319.1 conserved Plasmodium protein, unknown function [Plasmodium malariae]